MYDYKEAMKEDIREYIQSEGIDIVADDRDRLESELYDTLWTTDCVTGNVSGSYSFSRRVAWEYVEGNIDLLEEACREFGIEDSEVGRRFLNEDYEYFDVTIRCYLLSECLNEVLNELEHDTEEGC